MKRIFSGLLALTLALSVLAGCSGKETQEPSSGKETQESSSGGIFQKIMDFLRRKPSGGETSGIFYDVTGIDPKSTAMTVGDVEFPADMYLYWTAYAASSLEYNINMYYSYYGLYADAFDEEGNLLWDADVMGDGATLSEQVREQTEGNMLFYAAIESKAKELGVELTEDDQAELDANFAETMEQMGGEEEFQKNLELMGLSRESFDRISADALLFNKLMEKAMEEGSPLYVSPEEYEKTTSYADHILLMTMDQDTYEPLSDEEIAEKQATAQDLLSRLQNAGDGERESLFDELAAEYSEDPGRALEKGYLVTEDTDFVPEFLEAALSLEPGGISDIIESSYGYHILYRRHLTDASESQLSTLAEEHLYNVLDEYAETLESTTAGAIAALDVGEFYTAYSAKVEEISAAQEAENTGDDDAPDGTDTGDDAAGDGTPDGGGADE